MNEAFFAKRLLGYGVEPHAERAWQRTPAYGSGWGVL